jgi:Eukaryotic translation initiation factor 4G1
LRDGTLGIDFNSLSSSDVKPRLGLLLGAAKAIPPLQQSSAIVSAMIIEDPSNVSYPDGIMSPKLELNVNAKKGKFR